MSIAQNIKTLRKSHKLSQLEFGKIAGVSDKAVSTWENGEKVPRMGAIQKIADHFGIAKSDIIEDDPIKLASDESSLISDYRSLNDIGKEKVREIASDYTKIDMYKKLSEPALNKKEEPTKEDVEEVELLIAARGNGAPHILKAKKRKGVSIFDMPDYRGGGK